MNKKQILKSTRPYNFKKTKAFVDRDGYRYIPYNPVADALYKAMFVRNFAPEHRVVMARKLQRALDKTEHVHHKDHNRLNNDINNLDIINILKHIEYHKQKGNLSLFSKEYQPRWKPPGGLKPPG